jgi:hypothetical protein
VKRSEVKIAAFNSTFTFPFCCCIVVVCIFSLLAVVVSFIVVFVYCVLLESVVTSCNVCYLSVVSYCGTTTTGLKPNYSEINK